MSVKKRFIAGAICPRCEKQDVIMVFKDDETQIRECVACDFSDDIRIQSPVIELTTRVNQTAVGNVREVKIVDPKETR